MVLRRVWASWLDSVCQGAEAFFIVSGSIVGTALALPDEAIQNAPFWLQKAIYIARSTALYSLLISSISAGLIHIVRKRFLGSRLVWENLHNILDVFRRRAMPNASNSAHNRVTLFKHVGCIWRPRMLTYALKYKILPFGWLVPVDRSGERTLNPTAIFFAPKRHPHKAEGFAGDVWYKEDCQYLGGLPLLRDKCLRNPLRVYCAATKSAEEHIKAKVAAGKTPARSFWGIPVETSDGKPWGILLIDSESEDLMGRDEIKSLYLQLAPAFESLLKEV
jgi:hypothetical protein